MGEPEASPEPSPFRRDPNLLHMFAGPDQYWADLRARDLENAHTVATQNKRISKATLKNPDILQQAKHSYEEKLPAFIDEITTVPSNPELHDACLRFGDILRQPFDSIRRP